VIRIALDAMGGDNAPRVEIEGAAQALKELPPVNSHSSRRPLAFESLKGLPMLYWRTSKRI